MVQDWAYRIGTRLGRELTEEEAAEVDLWEQGRELQHLVNLPGWDVALKMLASYAQHANDDLLSLAPGNPAVPQAHAAAAALRDLYVKFIQDVQNAINQDTPAVMQAAVRSGGAYEIPVSSL